MIDTHCHLDDSKIIDKAFEIKCAKNVGVDKIINIHITIAFNPFCFITLF